MDCVANVMNNSTIKIMVITSRIITLETHVKLITGVSDAGALY
jgi:hypothetical protein